MFSFLFFHSFLSCFPSLLLHFLFFHPTHFFLNGFSFPHFSFSIPVMPSPLTSHTSLSCMLVTHQTEVHNRPSPLTATIDAKIFMFCCWPRGRLYAQPVIAPVACACAHDWQGLKIGWVGLADFRSATGLVYLPNLGRVTGWNDLPIHYGDIRLCAYLRERERWSETERQSEREREK